MKAAVYEGPRTVTVKDAPDAKTEHPCDIIVKITATNICGSDLHMYDGRTSFESGRTLGHENMGQVVELGSAVRKVQVGEYVVLPFNIACGFCMQCERGLTNYCLTMQPEPALAGAADDFADMGPYQGGQAELLRVPYGDFNALRLGEDAAERQSDHLMLADIFPTGYRATQMANVKPGDQTIVFGAGPVGLMVTYLLTLNSLIDSVRFTGDVGVVGVFLPQDPGGAEAQSELEAQGKVPIDSGMMWFKGQHVGTGQAPVKKYNRALRDLIASGKTTPGFVVSHEFSLDEAPTAYEHFDARDEGWTQEVLHPDGHGNGHKQ
ncbi:alcohol dehydrogenase catalytic domain-containing protein [Streptomyces sp. MH60]|uniref:alcohol dehydrogenase catalytic domain-containing protein n=1 Tax=Streptomyces sp. MH60 TaxID=1940758 RepID=UPI000D3FD5C4|nr:alcohol dehydrogenase catalytic domain-containing protein [Streptomyces sp. MH60]PPS91027.1 Glutathione-independent formaldehyde dehydrogenase [Streptomyces sp. MH60]